jgi:hypothetical protein
MYLILKIFISPLTLVGVSEIAKRTPGVGGLIASLPLVSILALSWLYLETRDTGKVIALSESIFLEKKFQLSCPHWLFSGFSPLG